MNSRLLLKDDNLSSKKILVIELEPTPYKADLWNVFENSEVFSVSVLYTESKNWNPDGGHNYKKWPTCFFQYKTMSGKGWLGVLHSCVVVSNRILTDKSSIIYIAGYDRVPTISAIIFSALFNKKFVIHADQFNIGLPPGRFSRAKLLLREFLRKIIFKKSLSVLVCGKKGLDSAKKAGCPEDKLLDFPYVIDVNRMRSEFPITRPTECQSDVDLNKVVIIFSGRMIPRKGLETLLLGLSNMKNVACSWVLWIEGDGQEREKYQKMAIDLNVGDYCRFIGFCQYDVHSWLMNSSDIVVVPSLEDTWGIVVDEGLQLGKAVVSSDATGSGHDRIENGLNGYLFAAGDHIELGGILESLICNESKRRELSSIAIADPKNIQPKDNVQKILDLLSI